MRVRASMFVLVKNCEENFPVLNRLVMCVVWWQKKKCRNETTNMKVCLVSTSSQQTSGYALVAFHILHELSKTCEVAHFATHARGKGGLVRNTLTGVDTEEHADFAFESLRPFCETRGVDVVLIYNDIGVVLSYLQHWTPPRLWVYLDVVAHGIAPPLLRHIHDRAERIFLMTEYWRSIYPFPN